MEKLTKKQRHEVYNKALDNFLNGVDSNNGLCFLIARATRRLKLNDELYDDIYESHESKYFPEYANTFDEDGWYDLPSHDWSVRLILLMFCIEMTRP